MSMNRVCISGNLTRDPEMRMTPSGMNILTFGVAVNDRRKNSQTGQWEDHPNFVDCVLFGQRAVSLQNILTKGFKVAIEGKLRYSSWEDKGGNKRSKLEVVVDDIDFMQGRGQGNQAQAGYQRQQPAPAPSYQAPAQPAPMPAYQTPQPVAAQPVQPVQAQPVAVQPAQMPATPAQAAPAAPVAVQPVQQAPLPTTASQGEPASVYDPDIPF